MLASRIRGRSLAANLMRDDRRAFKEYNIFLNKCNVLVVYIDNGDAFHVKKWLEVTVYCLSYSTTSLLSTRQRRLRSGETLPPAHPAEGEPCCYCARCNTNNPSENKQQHILVLTRSVETSVLAVLSTLQQRVVAAWLSRRLPAPRSAGGRGGWSVGYAPTCVCWVNQCRRWQLDTARRDRPAACCAQKDDVGEGLPEQQQQHPYCLSVCLSVHVCIFVPVMLLSPIRIRNYVALDFVLNKWIKTCKSRTFSIKCIVSHLQILLSFSHKKSLQFYKDDIQISLEISYDSARMATKWPQTTMRSLKHHSQIHAKIRL